MHSLPPMIEALQRLVAIPTVSSRDARLDCPNLPLVEQLGRWLSELGFVVQVQRLPWGRGKANLIASRGQGPGGLVLAGHTDTVPAERQRWSQDPWTLTQRGERLVGLGAADMKGFFAAVLQALQRLGPGPLREPLHVVATADEECTMDGARHVVADAMPKARWVIVGEPTSLRPVRLHKGIFMEAITLQGQSGHSSDPRYGRSALEGMHAVMSALLSWREQELGRQRHELFDWPAATLNLGRIEGGDAPNRICGQCEVQLDVRVLPGMDVEQVRARMRELVREAVEGLGLQVQFRPLVEGNPAFEAPASSELVEVAEEVTAARATTAPYCTEAPFYAQVAEQVIVLGPGNIGVAHQPDEYVEHHELSRAAELLERLIRMRCGDG